MIALKTIVVPKVHYFFVLNRHEDPGDVEFFEERLAAIKPHVIAREAYMATEDFAREQEKAYDIPIGDSGLRNEYLARHDCVRVRDCHVRVHAETESLGSP